VQLTCGLRPGEAAGLSWGDVDFDKRRLVVRRAVRLERRRPVIVETLKTSKSRRTVDLPAVTVAALKRHRTLQKAERLAAREWADETLVFSTGAGMPLDPANMRRELTKVTDEAGLGKLTPNELRHSCASLLSDSGVSLERISDALGHTNTRMLENVYRHAVGESATATRAMDAVLR
jgi:integrase